MSVSYSAYQPSGQLGSKLEHVIITFQKNEIPLFGRAVEVVGWQSIFIVILCTLKQKKHYETKMIRKNKIETYLKVCGIKTTNVEENIRKNTNRWIFLIKIRR